MRCNDRQRRRELLVSSVRCSEFRKIKTARRQEDEFKGYISRDRYMAYRGRYKECIRMLNGLEKSLERHLPSKDHRWLVREDRTEYGSKRDSAPTK